MSRNKSSSVHGWESAVGRAQVRRRFLRVKKPARETAPAPSPPLPKRSRASRPAQFERRRRVLLWQPLPEELFSRAVSQWAQATGRVSGTSHSRMISWWWWRRPIVDEHQARAAARVLRLHSNRAAWRATTPACLLAERVSYITRTFYVTHHRVHTLYQSFRIANNFTTDLFNSNPKL